MNPIESTRREEITEKTGHLYERARDRDVYDVASPREKVHVYEVAKDAADNTYDADTSARHEHATPRVPDRSENVATRAVEEAGYLAEKSKEGVEDAYAKTKDVASRVAGATKDAARGAIDATKSAAHTVADRTRDAAHVVVEKTKGAAEKTKDLAEEGAESMGGLYQRAKDGTTEAWERGRDAAKAERVPTEYECPRVHGPEGHGTTTGEMLLDAATGTVERVRSTVGGLVSMVTGAGHSEPAHVVDRAETQIERAKAGVKDAYHRGAEKAEDALEPTRDGAAAKGKLEDTRDEAKAKMEAARDETRQTIEAGKQEADNSIEAAKARASEKYYREKHESTAWGREHTQGSEEGREHLSGSPGVIEKSREVAAQAYHAVIGRAHGATSAVANALHKVGDAVGLTTHYEDTPTGHAPMDKDAALRSL